jgi:hypothetical protein
MSALVTTRRKTIADIAFFEEAHRRSNHCVAFLNDARLGQSLECGRREGKLCTVLDHTLIAALVPAALPLFALSASWRVFKYIFTSRMSLMINGQVVRSSDPKNFQRYEKLCPVHRSFIFIAMSGRASVCPISRFWEPGNDDPSSPRLVFASRVGRVGGSRGFQPPE